MLDDIDQSIQNIAVKHGVVLGKDDPILILQTMNSTLLEVNRKAQEDLLTQFKAEMESISSQWKDDAQIKAEKILNTALIVSKESMIRLFQQFTNESVQAMKKMISDSLIEAHDLAQQTRRFSRFALWSSAAILITASFLIFFFLAYVLRGI